MSDPEAPDVGQTYRIGAVARLTGIPPDTLRVWERRYTVVSPIRSEAGTRLYRADDVGRLTLIKRLVDSGDAISHVAGLSLEQLRERLQGLGGKPMEGIRAHPCRVAVLGDSLPALLRANGAAVGDDAAAVHFVGLYTDEASFRDEAARLDLDLAILECPTLHADQLPRVTDLLTRSRAAQHIVVYNFASRSVLKRLEAQRVLPRRAPVEVEELKRWCLSLQGLAEPEPSALLAEVDFGGPVPPRRFDAEALSRIALASPTVRCECPHHLVELVSSLAAFERYSQECENRNVDDAALHAFLYAVTARARATMESALARVIEAEGIEI
ncbi:MAG: MerR family transcriptional regulator [Thiohalocapsa sp.]|nr:MerR family transcriptional regulator [Thiohalocapsa sp.]